MAEVKWIKLDIGFPDNKKVKRIRKMPDGNNIILFWVFLLSRAGESNQKGGLFFTESVPYTDEDFAADFDFSIEFVRFAILTLEKYKMIEVYEDIIFIKNWDEYQQMDKLERVKEQNRIRQANYREKQKLIASGKLEDNENVTENNADVTLPVTENNAAEIELDLDLELELERTNNNNNNKAAKSEINIHQFYQQNFGVENSFVSESLEYWIEDLTAEVVLEALKQGATIDRPNYKYVDTVMKSWANKGITTVEAAKAEIMSRNRNMQQGNGKGKKTVKDGESYGKVNF